MSNCPLPDFNKYLRYAAYVELRDAILNEVKSYNVQRPSAYRVYVTVCVQELGLATKYAIEDVSAYDDIETMLAKKYATELNDMYRDYINEAASSFIKVLSDKDRPTIATIAKLLNRCVDSVTEDLLDVTR